VQLNRNYKYRIYPNKHQIDLLNQHFFTSNQAYNFYLDSKIKSLKANADLPKADRNYKKFADSYIDVKNDLASRHLTYNSGVIQDSMRKLELISKRFFSKKSEGYGFPKFKSSRLNEQSFIIRNQATSWDADCLKIFKQSIKWALHRDIPKDAKFTGGIVKRTSDGNYWVILNLTIEQEYADLDTGRECGIDLNVKNIAISESGGASYLIPIPDFSKSKYSKTYNKVKTQLSKRYLKKNFSKKTKKLQIRLNRIQQKIKNQKEDFFHKVSKDLTHSHNRITIEDLKISKMKESPSKGLNRQISDVSWNSVITKIKYKAEMKNVQVREINPAYSSQRCNACGHISRNSRKTQSVFDCENCHHTENADLNASKNILQYDNWSLEQKTRWTRMSIESSQVSIESNSILLGAVMHQLEVPSFMAG
jgi:putative transposase